MYRVWDFVTNYSILLIAGALIALVWANIDSASYHHFIEFPLVENFFIGSLHGGGGRASRGARSPLTT